MCGIFGYIGKDKAAQIVLSGLKDLEYRGYDSWGIATVGADKIEIAKNIGQLKNATLGDLPETATALGHTRWATHGGVTRENAHPHLDCTGKIAVVHNGIIENYLELRKKLQNHKFLSETDTEVMAHLVEELCRQLPMKEAVLEAFRMVKGSNAFVFLTQDGGLVAVKNGSPLVVGMGQNQTYLASDTQSLSPFVKKVIFLDDDQMVVLSADKAAIFSTIDGSECKFKFNTLDIKHEQVSVGNYRHFMEKEIHEQPKVIENVLGNVDSLSHLSGLITKAKGIFYVGCGTASYVALAQDYLSSTISDIHVNFTIGSEFKYLQNFINKGSLVVAISQSGETIDVIESVKAAKKKGAKIAAVTNSYNSTLWRISDYPIQINAGPEKAVCATKSFSSMVAHMIYLNYIIAGKQSEGETIVLQASKAVKSLLGQDSLKRINQAAKFLEESKNIYIIGRGISYPAALESALKLKEVAYIHSEGFAGGELKHGVIALIEKGTPCIVLAPDDETFDDVINNAIEIKARGGMIIGISPKQNDVFDYHLPYESCGAGSIIPSVVVSQLLAYYIAVLRGYDPDKPRNLAKSVTVK